MARRSPLIQEPPKPYETPLAWPHMPCGLHWPPWTDDRLEFIGREYAAGTPLEIIDRCALEMDGDPFTPDDLAELIEARGWQRCPDWDEQLAWDQWRTGLSSRFPRNQGLGPFGVPLPGGIAA